MKVVFSHGKESGPWGSKIKTLAAIAEEFGCSTDSIDYQDIPDPDQRVERLVEHLKQETGDFVLVGSSMGGYVSLVASEQIVVPMGIFLLAPALYIPGYARQTYPRNRPVEIIHGWSDDVIPVANSINYAQRADCTLHLIAGDHRLNTSLDQVTRIFRSFLQTFTMPQRK